MIRQIPECPFSLIDDTMPPRHPNGDDNDDEEEEEDENGGTKEDLEPPVVREPEEGE